MSTIIILGKTWKHMRIKLDTYALSIKNLQYVILNTERQLVTPFLCIHLHKLKFESLNWSTIGCEAAASCG